MYDVVTYLSNNSLDISSTVEKIHNSHQISCFNGSNQIIILQENINHCNHSHHYTFFHSDLVTGSQGNHLITCSCRCTHYRFASKIHFISFLHTFSYRDLQCTLKGDSSMLCPKLYSRTELYFTQKRHSVHYRTYQLVSLCLYKSEFPVIHGHLCDVVCGHEVGSHG